MTGGARALLAGNSFTFMQHQMMRVSVSVKLLVILFMPAIDGCIASDRMTSTCVLLVAHEISLCCCLRQLVVVRMMSTTPQHGVQCNNDGNQQRGEPVKHKH